LSSAQRCVKNEYTVNPTIVVRSKVDQTVERWSWLTEVGQGGDMVVKS